MKKTKTSLDISVGIIKAFIDLKAQEVKALELNEELEASILIEALIGKLEDLEEYWEDLPHLMKGGKETK